MNACSPRNPNICLDCEALTLDDSPSLLASQTEAEPTPQESFDHWLNKPEPEQPVPANYPNHSKFGNHRGSEFRS